MNRETQKKLAEERRLNPAVGFGTSFAAGMAIFGMGGHWLDLKFGKEHFFTLIGIGLGLLYGVWELWKLISISTRKIADKKQNPDWDKEKTPREHRK